MKIYDMSEKPENALKFICRELCDENYPSDEEIESLKFQLKELLSEKEKRKISEKIEFGEDEKSDEEIQKILNEKFIKFQLDENGKSLLKKHLSEEIFNNLCQLKTSCDGTLLDNIQSGLTIFDQEIGVFASDENSYETFAELFDPILNDLHQNDDKNEENDEEIEDIKDLDPEKLFIKSISIELNRSVSNIPFLSIASSDEMKEVVDVITEITNSIDDENFKGNYQDFMEISDEQKETLIEDGILFRNPENEVMKAAETYRLWPYARGIFLNDNKNLKIWINEQEHILISSFENSGDFKSIYERLTKFLEYFEQVEFAEDDKWGFLAHNLNLIGNGIKIKIDIKIPQLLKEENKEKFDMFVDEKFFNCKALGHGIMQLSTKQRIGISQQKLISKFQSIISEIISAEKCLYKQ